MRTGAGQNTKFPCRNAGRWPKLHISLHVRKGLIEDLGKTAGRCTVLTTLPERWLGFLHGELSFCPPKTRSARKLELSANLLVPPFDHGAGRVRLPLPRSHPPPLPFGCPLRVSRPPVPHPPLARHQKTRGPGSPAGTPRPLSLYAPSFLTRPCPCASQYVPTTTMMSPVTSQVSPAASVVPPSRSAMFWARSAVRPCSHTTVVCSR